MQRKRTVFPPGGGVPGVGPVHAERRFGVIGCLHIDFFLSGIFNGEFHRFPGAARRHPDDDPAFQPPPAGEFQPAVVPGEALPEGGDGPPHCVPDLSAGPDEEPFPPVVGGGVVGPGGELVLPRVDRPGKAEGCVRHQGAEGGVGQHMAPGEAGLPIHPEPPVAELPAGDDEGGRGLLLPDRLPGWGSGLGREDRRRAVFRGRGAGPLEVPGPVVAAYGGEQIQRFPAVDGQVDEMHPAPHAEGLLAPGVARRGPQRLQHRRVVVPAFAVGYAQLGFHPAQPQRAVEPHIWLRAGGVRRVVDFYQDNRVVPGYAQGPERLLPPGVLPRGGGPFPVHPGRVE